MTSRTLKIHIKRGLFFAGMELSCYADPAESVPTDLTGWVPYLQATQSAGAAPVFSLAMGPGGQSHQVVIQSMTGAQTLDLPEGQYQADLIFRDAEGRLIGPFARASIQVESIYFQPPSAP